MERSEFDQILIDRASECGADVRFGCEVNDILSDDGCVVGVQYQDRRDKPAEISTKLVIDATGLRALIPAKFGLRTITCPQRMGIYAQYAAGPTRDDAQEGWFVGQMFYDGWTWLIRLPEDRFSVGVVLTVDRFRKSGLTPSQLLEKMVRENDLLNHGMTRDRRRISDVLVTGNMGSSSQELTGPGWVAVGDAAYFIDPCYSSGVHLAMKSAEMVADIVRQQPAGTPIDASIFEDYECEMRRHEKSVHKMVDAFYIASRNTSVQKMVTTFQGGYFNRRFIDFVGGDFLKNSGYIRRIQILSKIAASLFGNNAAKSPQNSPEYLIDLPVVNDRRKQEPTKKAA